MKEVALICPPEAEAVGNLVASQSLETGDLFTLTQVRGKASLEDVEKIARSADGAVAILSDQASAEDLDEALGPFTRNGTPLLGLRVYRDDPVPDRLAAEQVTALSLGAVSHFIDSLPADS